MSPPLAPALRLQSTIIHALILQDMSRRYANTRLGALTAVIEPVLVVAALYLFRVFLQGQVRVGGMPVALYLVTGFMPGFAFRIVASTVMSAAERKASARMFPQVTSLDVLLASAISSSMVSVGAMLIVFVATAVGLDMMPADLLMVFLASWLTCVLGAAVGIVLGVVLRRLPGLRLVISSLLRINFILSGVAFLGTEVPPGLLPYVSWNPTFHAIEMMREGWFRGYVSPVAEPLYILACVTGLVAVGLPLERITNRKLLT